MTPGRVSAEHYYDESPTATSKLGLVRTQLRGKLFEFLTASSVFSKMRVDLGTRLLIESMILPEFGSILDVGCGYGAVGIVAAALKPHLHVVMTDINARAVQLARINCEKNRIKNCEVIHGYLYDSVKDRNFDSILSNPPVSAGMTIVRAIISGAEGLLNVSATFQMVIRSKIGAKTLPSLIMDEFHNCSIIARESGYRVLFAEKQ